MVRSRVKVGVAGADVQRDAPKRGEKTRDACVVQFMNVPLQEHIGHLKVNLQGCGVAMGYAAQHGCALRSAPSHTRQCPDSN